MPKSGNLTKWAKQGVLLLNTVLTVREHYANSHKNKGWETFTNAVIEKLNEREDPIIFLLWGNDAKRKKELITNKQHIVLTAAHPSPLSAYNGFFGCHHFSKTNQLLINMGKETIDSFNTSDTRGNSPSYGTSFQKLGHELLSRDELAVLDGGKCILQLRGVRPFLSDKYDLTQHPNYKLTSDYDPKNTFDIEKYLNRKEKINSNDEFVVIDADSIPSA